MKYVNCFFKFLMYCSNVLIVFLLCQSQVVYAENSDHVKANNIKNQNVTKENGAVSLTNMVLIEGGEYTIGSNEEDVDEISESLGLVDIWFENERPEHKVTLSSFYLDIYEVTNNDYKEFVDATKYTPPKNSKVWKKNTFSKGFENKPVIMVTWFDAFSYCKWKGKRLPKEVEWEAAARGKEGLIYTWSNNFDLAMANISGKKGVLDVGSYKKTPAGLYDMTGNVWEWTDSWYKPYEGNKQSKEKYAGINVVLRGSSWMGGHFGSEDQALIIENNARASFRLYLPLRGKSIDIGFRCAK